MIQINGGLPMATIKNVSVITETNGKGKKID